MANKEEILGYVMTSPQNTNPAVLGNMLDNYEGGSSGGAEFIIIGDMDAEEPFKTPQEAAELLKAGNIVRYHYYESESQDDTYLHLMLGKHDKNVIGYTFDYAQEGTSVLSIAVELIGNTTTNEWEWGNTPIN